MLVSPFTKRIGGAVAVLAVLVVLRMKPWASTSNSKERTKGDIPTGQRETLTVGFLPVT